MEFLEFKRKIGTGDYNVEFDFIESDLFLGKNSIIDNNVVENRKIKIFYLIRKSSIDGGPYVIFFNGGPGTGFSDQFFDHDGYRDFLPDYNVVFMDQRGTGFSDGPSGNLYEYPYFSSRYICYDSELIRKKLIGSGKWIVFGQSFGGHLVRKYLEIYCENAQIGISHGYGECLPITMNINIEKILFKQAREYFAKYPKDKKIFNNLKSTLTEDHVIGSEVRSLRGKDIIDIFSFYFGLYTYEKIHEILSKFSKLNLIEDFLNEVKFLGEIILNSGITNAVVAYIDLVDGLTDNEIYKEARKKLSDEAIILDDEMFSRLRLSKNVISNSKEMKEIESIFENKGFEVDLINMKILCENLEKNKVTLNVIGSYNDSITPIEAIEEEKRIVEKYDIDEYYKFIFSDGNHREWKENKDLLKKII